MRVAGFFNSFQRVSTELAPGRFELGAQLLAALARGAVPGPEVAGEAAQMAAGPARVNSSGGGGECWVLYIVCCTLYSLPTAAGPSAGGWKEGRAAAGRQRLGGSREAAVPRGGRGVCRQLAEPAGWLREGTEGGLVTVFCTSGKRLTRECGKVELLAQALGICGFVRGKLFPS